MKFSFQGSIAEFKAILSTPPVTFGDPLPPPIPPPPPPSCELTSDECARLKSSLAALAAAGSGAFLTTDQGAIRTIDHPSGMGVMVWTPNAQTWTADIWPPA